MDRQLDVLPALWIAEFRPQLASVHIREPGTAVEKSRGGDAISASGDAMVQPYVLRRRRRGRVLHGSRAATLRSPSPRHYRSPRVPVRS